MSILIVAYDISNDKLRTKFSKFLKKFGRKIQYSVVEIKNSPRILRIVKTEIEMVYKPKFALTDSVLIFPISPADQPKVQRYGWPVLEEEEVVVFE
jgi:CRISPR-associated protein Cas2